MVMPARVVDARSHQTAALIVNSLRFEHHHVGDLILGLKPSDFGHQRDDALQRRELTALYASINKVWGCELKSDTVPFATTIPSL